MLNKDIKVEMNQKLNSEANKNIDITEIRSLKRRYFSDRDSFEKAKKLRKVEENHEKINKKQNKKDKILKLCVKRHFNDDNDFDILTTSMCKKIKMEEITKINHEVRRKVKKVDSGKDSVEDKRVISLIDELRKAGNAYVKSEDYELAYHQYSMAINSCGKYKQITSICLSNRALCLLKMNRVSDALEDCTLAISLDENNYKVYLRKIKCLIELGRYVEAEKDAIIFNKRWTLIEGQELLKVVINMLRLEKLITEGDFYTMNSQNNEALICYNEAIKIDCQISTLYEERASIYFRLKRYTESLKDINEAMNIEPGNEAFILLKIECLLKLERFHEAVKEAQDLYKNLPSNE